jgi:hypothetical protein
MSTETRCPRCRRPMGDCDTIGQCRDELDWRENQAASSRLTSKTRRDAGSWLQRTLQLLCGLRWS